MTTTFDLASTLPIGGALVDGDGDEWRKLSDESWQHINHADGGPVEDGSTATLTFINREYGLRYLIDPPQPNLLDGTERFMRAAGQPIAEVPAIPTAKSIAARLHMLLEEVGELAVALGFSGLVDATLAVQDLPRELLEDRIQGFIDTDSVDLVEVVDAYNDIIVISHGGNLETAGSKGSRLSAAEVTRSNDDKVNGKHGPTQWAGEPLKSKVLKPIEQGWQGPDIVAALTEAGWKADAQ